MAKYYGPIGYVETRETTPGVWTPIATERNYYGDVLDNNRRVQTGESLNDNISVENRISILADPYANQNFHLMRYIVWMGASWKIAHVRVKRPRLILTLGGVYNGPKPKTETP